MGPVYWAKSTNENSRVKTYFISLEILLLTHNTLKITIYNIGLRKG